MEGVPLQPVSPHWTRPAQPNHAAHNNNGPYSQNERDSSGRGGGGGGGYGAGGGYGRGLAEGLPPLQFADSAFRDRKNNSDGDQKHAVTMSTMTTASALASPNHIYSGPPPPYFPSTAPPNPPQTYNGYVSPTHPRRASEGGEKEPPRQSLPSIHEALGKDPAALYSSAAPITTNIIYTAASQPPLTSPTTSLNSNRPQLDLHPSGPPNPYAAPSTPASSLPAYSSGDPAQDKRIHPPSRQSSNNDDSRKAVGDPPLSAHSVSAPSPGAAIGQSPRSMHFPSSSPMYPPATHSIMPVPAPGYHTFPPPATSYPPPPPPISSYTYPPAYAAQNSWQPENVATEPTRAAPVESPKKTPTKKSPGGSQHYGESVKRHLEIFDIETSLNEIAEGCGRALDFARHYGNRAHQTQRSGPTTASMPSLADIDDMIRRQKAVLDSMNRIREVVVNQQDVIDEQARSDEASKANSQPDFSEDQLTFMKNDDGSGGFAGADAKKRRGRNAPPGRCHSCNRAETPEWRRGPDGARTLCNACGLHYAKLTRKHGNKASLTSSVLRPKDPASP